MIKHWDPKLTRQEVINDFLAVINLKQEPPRLRSIFCLDGVCRLSFPWVTIGSYRWAHDKFSVYAYFHNREWHDFSDAFDVLSLPPLHSFHIINYVGSVCVGGDARAAMIFGELSPASAFWLSEMTCGFSEFPVAMCDTKNPELVLSLRWHTPLWRHQCRQTTTTGVAPNGLLHQHDSP